MKAIWITIETKDEETKQMVIKTVCNHCLKPAILYLTKYCPNCGRQMSNYVGA